MHKELGRDKIRPLIPGTTAAEVGLSTAAADYTHTYIWMPETGFERLDPLVNTRPTKRGIKNHGMELPVVNRLEKPFPENDIKDSLHFPDTPFPPPCRRPFWHAAVAYGGTSNSATKYPQLCNTFNFLTPVSYITFTGNGMTCIHGCFCQDEDSKTNGC